MKTMRQLGSLMARIEVIWGLVFDAVLPGGAQEKTHVEHYYSCRMSIGDMR
jgi:hypothetical protein